MYIFSSSVDQFQLWIWIILFICIIVYIFLNLEANPERFNSRLKNLYFYGKVGLVSYFFELQGMSFMHTVF